MAAQADGTWREEIRIHSYDVDFFQRATLEAICRLFLEAAWNHAEALGVGFAHLAEQHCLWVLVRLVIKLHRYPSWAETLTLNTWPRAAKGVFALREFELIDPIGNLVGGGSSAWAVLDAQTKKPQRIEKMLAGIRRGPERLAVALEPTKLSACQAPDTITRKTAYGDIDLNGHVNSGRYIGWLMDSYSFEFHKAHQVHLLEVNYLGETAGGETISIRSQQASPDTWCHAIYRAGTEVSRARMVWVRRNL